ncbi:MAG: LptF/LptG family permease [Rickettsiales bacterium]|jgi:lipopolysaccharide export system permease protein|nr:LptF/LptG family permease [Rickettsiales bacterium]
MMDKISLYLAGEFIKMFLLVFFVVSTIAFVVNFLEFFPDIQSYAISPVDALQITLFRIPWLVEPMLQFIVLLSVSFIMIKLLVKGELVILHSNGISDWKIVKLLSCIVFLLAIFQLTVYSQTSVGLLGKSEALLGKYRGVAEASDFMSLRGGIWLKYSGRKSGDMGLDPEKFEIIARADSVFLEKLVFNGVILLLSDEEGNFLRRINAKSMQLANGSLALENAYLFEQGKSVVFREKVRIAVAANEDFLRKQIQNKYKNPGKVDFPSLGRLIEDFKLHGLNTRRFEVRRNSMIMTPLIYVLMVFLGVLFSASNPRNAKHLLRILNVSVVGVCLFFGQNILTGLALAGTVNYLLSTWGFTILTLALAYGKLVDRIELQNL